MRGTRYPKIRQRLKPAVAGRLINEVREPAIIPTNLLKISVCPDPKDSYLVGLATAGRADFLLTGDMLGLRRFEAIRIVTVLACLEQIGRLP